MELSRAPREPTPRAMPIGVKVALSPAREPKLRGGGGGGKPLSFFLKDPYAEDWN